ncbi:pupal cuticle protein Edg-78E [Drosophila albomicans]|uniref:Pupal cuticle protein Edg-78E n=1 Tax=Drosophila albomicans TaxID=7291 RepID=A0A6P8Z369_DROAB|nr:pupal cuticle protein Edg-78E [Drosophila albomicans]
MSQFQLVAVLATAACLMCSLAVAQPVPSDSADAHAEIRSYENELKQDDNSYKYQFETSNGIAQQEQGVGGYYASGSSQYYAPEGQLIQLTYTADENGFQPQGEHLPTPHPIPEAILKSLEWNRNHPEEEQEEAHYHAAHEHSAHSAHGGHHQHGDQYLQVPASAPAAPSGLPYERKI